MVSVCSIASSVGSSSEDRICDVAKNEMPNKIAQVSIVVMTDFILVHRLFAEESIIGFLMLGLFVRSMDFFFESFEQ